MQFLTLIVLAAFVYVASRHATNELAEEQGKDSATGKRNRVAGNKRKTLIKRRKLFL
jgi:hypothetical protein